MRARPCRRCQVWLTPPGVIVTVLCRSATICAPKRRERFLHHRAAPRRPLRFARPPTPEFSRLKGPNPWPRRPPSRSTPPSVSSFCSRPAAMTPPTPRPQPVGRGDGRRRGRVGRRRGRERGRRRCRRAAGGRRAHPGRAPLGRRAHPGRTRLGRRARPRRADPGRRAAGRSRHAGRRVPGVDDGRGRSDGGHPCGDRADQLHRPRAGRPHAGARALGRGPAPGARVDFSCPACPSAARPAGAVPPASRRTCASPTRPRPREVGHA
jgi:hypothetical protein